MGSIKTIQNGYESLKAAVEVDRNKYTNDSGYQKKFDWVIDRAKHYGEKLDLDWQDVLTSWENDRSYWYMNYYQDSNQPEIKGEKVRTFESVQSMLESIGEKKFRCPSCSGVSTDPYECNSGKGMSKGKICDWKVYGLFGDLGKGIFVFCKDKLRGETIFLPLSWEAETDPVEQK